MPPIRTVGQPGGTIAGGGCGTTPGNEQMCGVPTVAAGMPAMSTVGTPGGPITPGCPVGSPTRAAAGIARSSHAFARWSLVDLHHRAGQRRRGLALEVQRRAGHLDRAATAVD